MVRRLLRHPVFVTGGIIILLLFLLKLGLLQPVDRFFRSTFHPIQARLYRWATALKTSPLVQWKPSQERDATIRELTEKRATLAREVAELRYAADENRTLRQLLKFREETRDRLIAARVLARTTEPGTFAALIDRGVRDEVREGFPVITGQGVLIGKIWRVYDSLAEVVFLPDPRFRAAIAPSASLVTNGVLRGEGGLSVLVDLIPAAYTIRVGDLIVSSGLETTVPRGYPVGTVAALLPQTDRLFQRAALEPLIPLARVTDVALILPPTP